MNISLNKMHSEALVQMLLCKPITWWWLPIPLSLQVSTLWDDFQNCSSICHNNIICMVPSGKSTCHSSMAPTHLCLKRRVYPVRTALKINWIPPRLPSGHSKCLSQDMGCFVLFMFGLVFTNNCFPKAAASSLRRSNTLQRSNPGAYLTSWSISVLLCKNKAKNASHQVRWSGRCQVTTPNLAPEQTPRWGGTEFSWSDLAPPSLIARNVGVHIICTPKRVLDLVPLTGRLPY